MMAAWNPETGCLITAILESLLFPLESIYLNIALDASY